MYAAPRFLANGDTVMVVEFGEDIDLQTSAQIMALHTRVKTLALEAITDLVPTFRSLAIHYDPRALAYHELELAIRTALKDLTVGHFTGRQWTLPTCYDHELAPDLELDAGRCSLSIEIIIAHHTAADYHVYMLGFLTGYPYLGDLASEIALPRKETPSIRIPARSVAIAEHMPAIYPIECPGGWYAIGRTPMPLFDPLKTPAALLTPGDRVRFIPIDRNEFDRLEGQHAAGRRPHVQHGTAS